MCEGLPEYFLLPQILSLDYSDDWLSFVGRNDAAIVEFILLNTPVIVFNTSCLVMWVFKKILLCRSIFDFWGIFWSIWLIKQNLIAVLFCRFTRLIHCEVLGSNKTLGCLSELLLLFLLVFIPRRILVEIKSSLARIYFHTWVLYWDLSFRHLVVSVVILEIVLIESICLRLRKLVLNWWCCWLNYHGVAEFILVAYRQILRLNWGQILLTVVDSAASYCLRLDTLFVLRQIIQRGDLFRSYVVGAGSDSASLI